MASNINPFNIDGTYPVAGQDNDSQGFRDNFTNTGTNFSIAYSEISDLQSKVLLKSALTGQSLNNSMGGASISGAALTGASYTLNDRGSLSGTVTLDFSTGNFQTITSGGALTLGFSNWPAAGQLGSMVVWLNITSVAHTVTIGASYTNISNISGANATNGVITFGAVGNYLLEFITTDAGTTVMIADRSRNYNSVQGNLTIAGGYINPNYIRIVSTTGATISANVMYTNWYLDSANSATLSTQTISMPYSGVEDGRTMTIISLCPITTTTFTGANIRYATSSAFSSGNVNLKLQYSTSANVWYRY
jgi:hypothetical protein